RAQAAAVTRGGRARIRTTGGVGPDLDPVPPSLAPASPRWSVAALVRCPPGRAARARRHQALQSPGAGPGARRMRSRGRRRGPAARCRRVRRLRHRGQPVRAVRRSLAHSAGGPLRCGWHLPCRVAGATVGARNVAGEGRRGTRRRGFPVQCGAGYPAGGSPRCAPLAGASRGGRGAGFTGAPASRVPTGRPRTGRPEHVSSKSKPRRGIGAFFVITALLAGALAFWAFDRYQGFADTPIAGLEQGARVTIERGDSFATVLGKLREAGARGGHDLEWRLLARRMGAAGRIQVGEYALEPGATPRQVLADLRDGKVVSYRFTIVEGWNVRELRAALARAEPLVQETAGMDDAALMEALGHPGVHPEGRFLPEAYHYVSGDSDLDLLGRAYAAMESALDEAWASRAAGLPLASKDEALVLASIVEKETGVAEERPRIAGVF